MGEKGGSGYVGDGSPEAISVTISRYREGNTDVFIGVLKFFVCDILVRDGTIEMTFSGNEALPWAECDRL